MVRVAHLPDTPQAQRVPTVASLPFWVEGRRPNHRLSRRFPQAQRYQLVDNTAAIDVDAGHEGRSTVAVGEGD